MFAYSKRQGSADYTYTQSASKLIKCLPSSSPTSVLMYMPHQDIGQNHKSFPHLSYCSSAGIPQMAPWMMLSLRNPRLLI